MSRKGWSLFFLVGFLWGVPYLFLKVAVSEFPITMVVFGRVIIGAAILLPVAFYQGSLKPALQHLPIIAEYAIFEMIGPWFLITSAERHISSGLAGLLIATVPIWATILASMSGDKTVWHASRLFGMIVGFLGIFLIVGIESLRGENSFFAIGQVLIAAACYSFAVNRVVSRIGHISGIAINGIALAMTAIVYLPFQFFLHPAHMPSAKAIGSVMGLGLLSTAAAFIVFFIVLAEVGPARGALVTYLNTAFAIVLGALILGEKITVGIVCGVPLVLIGSYFASRKGRSVTSETPTQ